MEFWVNKIVVTCMVSVIGFFAINTYTRLSAIECAMTEIKVEFARMRFLSDDDVRRICQYEIMQAAKGKTKDFGHGDTTLQQ